MRAPPKAHVNNFPIQRMQQLDHVAPSRHPARVRVLPLPLARPPQVQPNKRQVADPSALHTAHRARVASLRSRHLALPVQAAALRSARLVAFTIQKKSAVQPPSTRLASAPRNARASVAAEEQRARRLRMARDGALFFESQEGSAMFMHCSSGKRTRDEGDAGKRGEETGGIGTRVGAALETWIAESTTVNCGIELTAAARAIMSQKLLCTSTATTLPDSPT